MYAGFLVFHGRMRNLSDTLLDSIHSSIFIQGFLGNKNVQKQHNGQEVGHTRIADWIEKLHIHYFHEGSSGRGLTGSIVVFFKNNFYAYFLSYGI